MPNAIAEGPQTSDIDFVYECAAASEAGFVLSIKNRLRLYELGDHVEDQPSVWQLISDARRAGHSAP